jgi:uncharacterized protein (TIGR02300 family)
MPAKDLGTKYVCFKCGTRFYDLKRPAPVCPKCGADQRESPAVKGPAPERRRPPPRPVAPVVAADVEAEPLEDLEEEAADEAADEDEEP